MKPYRPATRGRCNNEKTPPGFFPSDAYFTKYWAHIFKLFKRKIPYFSVDVSLARSPYFKGVYPDLRL